MINPTFYAINNFMKAITGLWSILILWIFLALRPCAAGEQEIRVVTEHLPPYQFIGQNSHLTGLSIDIVKAMFEQAGVNPPIEVLPWARAYDIALTQKNVMIFSMARSPERQEQFKWVGDILKQNYYFLALKSRKDIQVHNIQDIKHYVTGVSRDSFEHQLLLKYGFSTKTNLRVNVAQLPLVEMLYQGKIDMVFGSKITLLGLMRYIQQDTSAINLVYRINESPGNTGIAMSRQTDDKVVEKYRQAFRAIKANGKFQQILDKWLSKVAKS